jgi:ketosteroid isomerase-like protein
VQILDAETVTRRFVRAFADADFAALRSLLADDAHAHITNAQGGVDRVDGADAYLVRVAAMDLASAALTITLTQLTCIAPEQVLAMVEIRASRRGRALHNFAAHLLNIRAGRIRQMWMVEAKPAESAQFWSS